MANTDYYYEKIKNILQTREDILTVNTLTDIDDIIPLFDKDFSFREYIDLSRILIQRYLVGCPDDTMCDINFSKSSISKDISYIDLFGVKDEILDLSLYDKLERVNIWGSKKVKEIILPVNGSIKALHILRLPNLEKIENIYNQDNLRFFNHQYASKIKNFSFISNLDKLVYLNMSGNKKVCDTDFLKDSKVYYLDLSETDVIKNEKLIDDLKCMKNLRVFNDGGNTQKMRQFFKNNLPNVCMRDY